TPSRNVGTCHSCRRGGAVPTAPPRYAPVGVVVLAMIFAPPAGAGSDAGRGLVPDSGGDVKAARAGGPALTGRGGPGTYGGARGGGHGGTGPCSTWTSGCWRCWRWAQSSGRGASGACAAVATRGGPCGAGASSSSACRSWGAAAWWP